MLFLSFSTGQVVFVNLFKMNSKETDWFVDVIWRHTQCRVAPQTGGSSWGWGKQLSAPKQSAPAPSSNVWSAHCFSPSKPMTTLQETSLLKSSRGFLGSTISQDLMWAANKDFGSLTCIRRCWSCSTMQPFSMYSVHPSLFGLYQSPVRTRPDYNEQSKKIIGANLPSILPV